tara:strand:+ start:314 stop:607 length:294 start_codon:yes stop_codon:yes gene_type:complete
MPDFMEKNFMDRYGRSGSCEDQVYAIVKKFVTDEVTGKTDADKLKDVARANGIDLERWSHLNPGHLRMNFNNVLRGLLRRGVHVRVGEDWIRADRGA